MISQVQLISKILASGDMSPVVLNNLDKRHFFSYESEFSYIVNHYSKYGKAPDKLTFLSVFPEFNFVDVAEPINFLLERLF
jgi:hypothetical protein